MKSVDLVVVGFGLAGAAMAWQASARSMSLMILDRSNADSCSRVAAGLVTPITGSRAASSWRWYEFFQPATQHYRRAEQQTGQSFWSEQPCIKIHQSPEERDLYETRWLAQQSSTTNPSIESDPQPQVERYTHSELASSVSGVRCDYGAAKLSPAARLDTVRYLEASHAFFQCRDQFIAIDLDCDRDLVLTDDAICIPRLNLKASCIVLCQGFAARENGWFRELPLHPARGDILTIESSLAYFDHVLHHDCWAVPLSGTQSQQYLVGATYDRHHLSTSIDNSESDLHREALCQRWESLVYGTFHARDHHVVAHRAGIRPASYDRHPLIGSHPSDRRLWCLNGLGSKGTLMAPRLAELLLDAMETDAAIDPQLDWQRKRSNS